jgi:hypothetical protein
MRAAAFWSPRVLCLPGCGQGSGACLLCLRAGPFTPAPCVHNSNPGPCARLDTPRRVQVFGRFLTGSIADWSHRGVNCSIGHLREGAHPVMSFSKKGTAFLGKVAAISVYKHTFLDSMAIALAANVFVKPVYWN